MLIKHSLKLKANFKNAARLAMLQARMTSLIKFTSAAQGRVGVGEKAIVEKRNLRLANHTTKRNIGSV